jgi:peptide deformylase
MYVVYVPETESFEKLINPVVASTSTEQGIYREMCLSGIPLSAEVIRPWEVEVQYMNGSGNILRRALDPIGSRVAQHEIDHLDGILFIDRADAKTLAFDFDWETIRERNQLRKLE